MLPLWVAVVVPAAAAAGSYSGTAEVVAGGHATSVAITLTVGGPALANGGDDDVARGTRLHWFDSKLGLAGDTVPSPYVPISVASTAAGATVTMLGKRLVIGASGLPSSIAVTLDHARAAPPAVPREALDAAMTFDGPGPPAALEQP